MKAESIIKQIQDDILTHRLELPSLPDIAIRIRESIHDSECDIHDLAELIQRDPALVAYLLHLANNPLYRGASKIDNVTTALNRLGLETTANLALTYAMRSLFSAETKAIRPWLKRSWLLSTHIAALASVLARHTQQFEPGRALIMALMQDIGTLPLLTKMANYPALLEDNKTMARLLEKYIAMVGVSILEQWNFDDDIIEAARSRKDWLRNPAPEPDYADLVLVARLHRYMGTAMAKRVPKISEIPAFRKLAIGKLSPRRSLLVLEEAREEVNDVRNLLNG